MKKILLAILLIAINISCKAQGFLPPNSYTSTNKKAIKKYEEGKTLQDARKNDEAEKCYLKAIEIDAKFVEPHINLGYLYIEKNQNDKAISEFQKAVDLNPGFFPNNFYQLAELQFYTGKYDGAKKNLETFLTFQRISPTLKEKSEFLLKCSNFAIGEIKNPKPYNPINVGSGVNSPDNEYFPTLTVDNQTMIFTRKLEEPNCAGFTGQEDFYTSSKQGVQQWGNATAIAGLNSKCNEGAPNISVDGNHLFFVSCEDPSTNSYGALGKGMGSCDIFYAQKNGSKWSKPINLKSPVNSYHWETQPSFSSDGKTLYFVRGIKRGHSVSEQDIYTSTIDENGVFGEPVKLGTNINTSGREESVFIHPDNNTLYFSSDGHVGMGGLDIFMSRRQVDGTWGPAINLGYPINTSASENSLLVDAEGKLAYFASAREGGFGGLDIYKFELPAEFKPEKITYVKGLVYDAKTKNPLEANFELIDLETQKMAVKSYSAANGEFTVTLNENKNYMVNVNKETYLFYSDNFSLKGVTSDYSNPFKINVPLLKLEIGATVELKNVFFDVNKWDLKPESKIELEKLAALLKANPKLKIELGGHTDNTGDKKQNQILSENRAKSVYSYLIKFGGIDATRLSFKGYGDTKPKVANDTAENKAKNRRTEFVVTGV